MNKRIVAIGLSRMFRGVRSTDIRMDPKFAKAGEPARSCLPGPLLGSALPSRESGKPQGSNGR